MRIDSWERLELVIELIKTSLPVDFRIDLNDADKLRSVARPVPYDPRIEKSTRVATPLPILAEVRVSLCIDETLAFLLPVEFSIDQFLTAEEVVAKLTDVFWFLRGWSQVHEHEGRELLRTPPDKFAVKPRGSFLIQ